MVKLRLRKKLKNTSYNLNGITFCFPDMTFIYISYDKMQLLSE
jgi:hypothetical protein